MLGQVSDRAVSRTRGRHINSHLNLDTLLMVPVALMLDPIHHLATAIIQRLSHPGMATDTIQLSMDQVAMAIRMVGLRLTLDTGHHQVYQASHLQVFTGDLQESRLLADIGALQENPEGHFHHRRVHRHTQAMAAGRLLLAMDRLLVAMDTEALVAMAHLLMEGMVHRHLAVRGRVMDHHLHMGAAIRHHRVQVVTGILPRMIIGITEARRLIIGIVHMVRRLHIHR